MNDKVGVDGSGRTTSQTKEGQDIRRSGTSAATRPDRVPVQEDSNRASQVLNEGRLLAGLLHHKEFAVAHLLLTIARTPDGVEQLQKWKVDPRNVNLLCWRELEKEEVWHSWSSYESEDSSRHTESDPNTRAVVSEDIMLVHRRAGLIAAERKQTVIGFNDLVEALVASRISTQFVHLYGTDVAEETRDLIQSTKDLIEKEFSRLRLAGSFGLALWVAAVAAIAFLALR